MVIPDHQLTFENELKVIISATYRQQLNFSWDRGTEERRAQMWEGSRKLYWNMSDTVSTQDN